MRLQGLRECQLSGHNSPLICQGIIKLTLCQVSATESSNTPRLKHYCYAQNWVLTNYGISATMYVQAEQRRA